MIRDELIHKIRDPEKVWDIVVIGGGATGLGVAHEAVTRGYRTVLLEEHDFAKGTSSRSTKLIHGGVRYLAQGNIRLVRSALRERGLLKQNAPHLVRDLSFVLPCYRWWEKPFYTTGLVLYDLLAGRLSIGRSKPLSRRATLRMLPGIRDKGLRGGVIYHDCQFDDARLAVNVCQSFCEEGGIALNYMPVTGLLKKDGKISGVVANDRETGQRHEIYARKVVNATGVFTNCILRMDAPENRDLVVPSQGVHLVLDKRFLDGDQALMIPRTPDGRVLFAIPWHGKIVVGTTDVQKTEAVPEPRATDEEIDYILETAGRYLETAPTRKDVRSVFAGLRPLAAPEHPGKRTKEIARGHKIICSESGLVTITGGKWTIYRMMGEDVINKLEADSEWPQTKSVTRQSKLHGYKPASGAGGSAEWYGSDEKMILEIIEKEPETAQLVSGQTGISRAHLIHAVRHEMARTLEDVLARRIRLLQLDAEECIRIASEVASIMAQEMGKDGEWIRQQTEEFTSLASNYLIE